MKNITFQNIMFGYASENVYGNPSKIKVYLPDLFPDKQPGKAIKYNTNNGSAKNIIINKNTPSISNSIENRNYLELSTIMKNVNINLNDKLVIAFVNSNPLNGVVLGKVE